MGELASITDWGKEFQSFITLMVKKRKILQFVCGLNNFILCPLVCVIVECEKKMFGINALIINVC